MVKLNELLTVLPIVSLIVIFLALFYFGEDLGFDVDMDMDFLQVLPGLGAVAVGFALTAITRGTYAFLSLTIVGFGFGFLFGTLNDIGMITSQMKTGLTIQQIQLWIVVIFGLIGSVVNAMALRSR